MSSLLISTVWGLLGVVGALGFVWYINLAPRPKDPVAVEIIDVSGGEEDGVVGETSQVESPENVTQDPTPAETQSDTTQIEASLDNVLTFSDDAVSQSAEQFGQATETTGRTGRALGTGRRGMGKGVGDGGIPRENRWFITYPEGQPQDEYSRLLDFFGIELGAIVGKDLVILSKLSSATPTVRRVTDGSTEQRLYLTWQAGARRQTDLGFFRKVGIDVGGSILFQFIPKPVEQQMAQVEVAFQRKQAKEIRRTYYSVETDGNGWKFIVTRQTLLGTP